MEMSMLADRVESNAWLKSAIFPFPDGARVGVSDRVYREL
jgi:hypothetical protein